jgi:signal transduction histidine kinase
MSAPHSPWRNRLSALRPRSLFAQMALAIALALTVAQGVNILVLLNGHQLSQIGRMGSLAENFCVEALRDNLQGPPPNRREQGPPLDGIMSLELVPYDLRGVPRLRRDPALEERVQSALRDVGIYAFTVQAGKRFVQRRDGPAVPKDGLAPPPLTPVETFVTVRADPQSDWLRCRVTTLIEDRSINRRVILGTLMMYGLVLGSLLFVTRRLVMPLSRLSMAVSRVGLGQSGLPMPSTGPSEIGAMTEAFNDMNARINQMLLDKDAILGALGHDLRTPLTALRIQAENLDPSRGRDRMIEAIDHLTHIVNGILDLSKIGGNKETAVPTDLTALITTIVEEFEDLGADVQLADGPRCSALLRPHLFMRLIRNLVENAVKYGGEAKINITPLTTGLRITIDDQGPGIAPETVEQLLKPFERLDASRNSASGGSGLGLTIAQMIAQAHGASLQFENRTEGGLRVAITLPTHSAKNRKGMD